MAPDQKLEGRNFEEVGRIALAHRLPQMSPAEIDAIVRERREMLRDPDAKPSDLCLSDGQVIRVNAKTLPDGSHMIVYTDVTDLSDLTHKLEVLATTDSLTGLFNRRQFLSLAEAEWSRYRRHRHALSVLMIDIDEFKLINDRFGHDAGDRVLAEVAALCRKNKRHGDVAARLGGDEFVMLLPETPLDAAVEAASRLINEIAHHRFLAGSTSARATLSVGAAEAQPAMASLADLMKSADRAVYIAKAQGRNRVCAAEPA
jgi:diguanylate cyclase (GGDEF)-like protein